MESKEKPSKVIAIIPARKGSKRLPGKNFKILNKKPLICWTIEQACQCEFIDEIIITTDDPEVVSISQQYIYDNRVRLHNRPPELAQDDTSIDDVINNLMINYPIQTIIILLQPTSPLRFKEDFWVAWDLFIHSGNPIISVFREDYLHFKLNGVIYIFKLIDIALGLYNRTSLEIYIMPKERSIDIDTLEDFQEAEKRMEIEK